MDSVTTEGPGGDLSRFQGSVLDWYQSYARDLPWRRPAVSPWGVLCSELMLQQTPVARVLPVWQEWMSRWPTPADLAASPAGAAVRAWGRLGYPRRALRLHACATLIVARHGGQVPAEVGDLRALPGVGDYTAAAVAAFAHRRRTVVLDTNVRRVLARALGGAARPPTTTPTAAERTATEALLPDDPAVSARWCVAVMELGALVCTARAPRCASCPVADRCRFLALGRPSGGAAPRTQPYDGTDRQCRGRLLAVLREAAGPVPRARLDLTWHDPVQRERALDGLVADGLLEPVDVDAFALPGTATNRVRERTDAGRSRPGRGPRAR